jgi:hypothetical protein
VGQNAEVVAVRDGREEEGLQAAVAAEEGVGSRPRWDGRARPWRRHAMMQVTIASVILYSSFQQQQQPSRLKLKTQNP